MTGSDGRACSATPRTALAAVAGANGFAFVALIVAGPAVATPTAITADAVVAITAVAGAEVTAGPANAALAALSAGVAR